MVPPARGHRAAPGLRRAPRRRGLLWNVMCVYPEESLGVVVMGNTTSYDHGSICDAIVNVPWE
ncbi:MAG: hypothetical protein AVDCRST_MAG05-2583 [uncultured Rubrobacteraceae bacterium]|uniref:Uncharacterized protein n=1 Tax=uncultured Rubrobacteraceae bacterium TaxID=349277 RepID=A0A6J4SRN6_9ACTN|nr:MAG: hypothetical protein AVDCRST_MAG05-2583 [uncultured Rubrobacteraceae bacterium]